MASVSTTCVALAFAAVSRRLAAISAILARIAAASTARILTPVSRVTWFRPRIAAAITGFPRYTCVATLSATGVGGADVRTAVPRFGDLWRVSSGFMSSPLGVD